MTVCEDGDIVYKSSNSAGESDIISSALLWEVGSCLHKTSLNFLYTKTYTT